MGFPVVSWRPSNNSKNSHHTIHWNWINRFHNNLNKLTLVKMYYSQSVSCLYNLQVFIDFLIIYFHFHRIITSLSKFSPNIEWRRGYCAHTFSILELIKIFFSTAACLLNLFLNDSHPCHRLFLSCFPHWVLSQKRQWCLHLPYPTVQGSCKVGSTVHQI